MLLKSPYTLSCGPYGLAIFDLEINPIDPEDNPTDPECIFPDFRTSERTPAKATDPPDLIGPFPSLVDPIDP